MSSVGTAGVRAGAYRALVLSTLAFALCFAVWGLVSPLATRFQELYDLSSTQISVVIATPVILGSCLASFSKLECVTSLEYPSG